MEKIINKALSETKKDLRREKKRNNGIKNVRVKKGAKEKLKSWRQNRGNKDSKKECKEMCEKKKEESDRWKEIVKKFGMKRIYERL